MALEICGKAWSVDALMEEVEKERMVMEESGGGVTLCGGEPLMHTDYLCEVLDELGKRDFHRTVDTTLFASPENVKRVAERCELFLVDLKLVNSEKHQRYTGVGNEQILANIQLLSEMGKLFWIRIPLIVGINADDENLAASAVFLASLPTKPEVVNLLVYHDVGIGKHARLGTSYNPDGIPMEAPSEELQQHALAIMQKQGLQAIIGG